MLRLLTGPSHISARHFYSGLTVEPGKPVILINCVGVKLIKAFVVSRIQTNLRYKCFTSVYITYNITVRNNGTMKENGKLPEIGLMKNYYILKI